MAVFLTIANDMRLKCIWALVPICLSNLEWSTSCSRSTVLFMLTRKLWTPISWNAPEFSTLLEVLDSYITLIRKVLDIGVERLRRTVFGQASRRRVFIATFRSCRHGFMNKISGSLTASRSLAR